MLKLRTSASNCIIAHQFAQQNNLEAIDELHHLPTIYLSPSWMRFFVSPPPPILYIPWSLERIFAKWKLCLLKIFFSVLLNTLQPNFGLPLISLISTFECSVSFSPISSQPWRLKKPMICMICTHIKPTPFMDLSNQQVIFLYEDGPRKSFEKNSSLEKLNTKLFPLLIYFKKYILRSSKEVRTQCF